VHNRGRGFVFQIKKVVQYILLGLYKVTFGLYIRKRYRARLVSGIKIKGPFLLLANHCSNYDGLFLQCFMSEPVHYIITDTLFKKKVLRGLFSLAGYIPKKKFVSDARAVKQILRTVWNGGSIGIMPEGERNWDGKTLHISDATYKLVKLLKIPVVTALLNGAYFFEPRWADTKRRGVIEIEMKLLLAPESISQMSVSQIGDSIASALGHSDFNWQRKRMIPYRGKALAEKIERLVFICPECGGIGTLRSGGSEISCSKCDEYGFIRSIKGNLPTEDLDALNDWQTEKLRERISSVKKGGTILSDEGASLLAAGSDNDPFAEVGKGDISLYRERLTVAGSVFDVENISGITMYFKSGLSFRYDSRDYRVCFDDPRVSIYKWCKALDLLKERR
jgi:1-acyl-sn-glycerol-3-phosphate acyltransferase